MPHMGTKMRALELIRNISVDTEVQLSQVKSEH